MVHPRGNWRMGGAYGIRWTPERGVIAEVARDDRGIAPGQWDRGDPRDRARIETETAPVTCWCEEELVMVSLADVRAGLTASCGAPDCHAPRNIPETGTDRLDS